MLLRNEVRLIARDEALRLPKTVENDPATSGLANALAARAEPLWAGAEESVPRVDVGPALESALKSAFSAGRIVRGLERATRTLKAEERGLRLVDEKTGAARGQRVSRLLVMTDDGAERFYRNAESLLRAHAPRVLGLRLATDQRSLGQLLFGSEQVARLLLVEHKDTVAGVLLGIAADWQSKP